MDVQCTLSRLPAIPTWIERYTRKNALKKIMLSLGIVTGSVALAAPPNPADYTVTLHITSSHLTDDCQRIATPPCAQLDVTTGGAKYMLLGSALRSNSRSLAGVLQIGDYKAKLIQLIKGNAKSDYLLTEDYDILLPDGKTASFQVIGQSE